MGATICWALWKARNSLVFENKQLQVQEILKIFGYWFNLYFGVAETMETEGASQPHVTDNNHTHTWIPPPTDTFKINVDAAAKNGHYASAAIVRNHEGKCCGASTRLGSSDALVEAEADGFSLDVDLAVWLGLESIIIEGDCQVVVNILNGETRNPLENMEIS
ncbi:uncharacterized protein LOC113273202 [Papaver somniferum]|uniref:uncharacterized protein LOC113273202 n=1 Tax=Papaver somniferum TaxID=3469 RepID=UPI000E7031EE|nr:uncharacterized protein LOC113273202 [Papaver somniferum]